MALHKHRDPALEALIQQAAAEMRRLDSQLFASPTPYTDEEYTEILREAKELDELWNTPEGQKARRLGFSASDMVDEDRGER
ncbi:MAG: hypothetical protein ACRDHP_00865 [Ktedonobacterales bacterium]